VSRPARGAARDVALMSEALSLARRGLGRTRPNPPVGAVVVRAGRVVGRGWHRRAGGPHAEVVALAEAGSRARGGTLYVTLEPCSHFGRTPPCAPVVVEAGLRRVVVGAGDPNPRVRGRGLRVLERAGVETVVGVCEAEARELIRAYARHVQTGLPFVRLKLAASADGKIAAQGGASRWITGPRARRLVHEWRDEFDAVLVGADTVLADDPALTCRRRGGRDPIRIVVDGSLRTPPTARLLRDGRSPVWIATRRGASARRAAALAASGAEVLTLPARRGHVDLGALLRELGKRDVVSLLVEGGSRLAGALLGEGRVDELRWFSAPILIGGDGIPMIGSLGVKSPQRALRLVDLEGRSVGRDHLWSARVERP
jgi:diaminohydroxyphosphoribosylaminopyrimidine deaminase / 5-amino-6-(5-phosphoribosylamino)uracil reductase